MNSPRETNLPYTWEEILAINLKAEAYIKNGDVSDKPQFVLIAGGVGAGKTTLRRKEYGKGYVNLDFGETFLAFEKENFWELEKENESKMAMFAALTCTIVLWRSIKERRNIVIEIIGDDYFAVKFITDMMLSAGYKIKMCPIYGDINEAIARHKQAVKDDPDYISAYHSEPPTISTFFQVHTKMNNAKPNEDGTFNLSITL